MGSSMLRWLPKKLSNHDYYFVQLLSVVCAAHILFFFMMLYWASRETLVVDVSGALVRGDMPIVIVPYVKRTGQLEMLARGLLKPSRKRARRNQAKRVVYKQTAVTRKRAGVSKRSFARTTQLTLPVKSAKKSLVLFKKEAEVKLQCNSCRKKKQIKKVVDPENLQIIAPEMPVTKSEPVPVLPIVPENSGMQVVSAQAPESMPVAEELEPVVGPLDITFNADQEAGGNEAGTGPLVLGQQEVEQLQRYQAVQERITPHWHPPISIKAVQACVLLATIGAGGVVEQMVVEQSSGVLAYDMAARMAVHKTQFPDNMIGQQVRLHF